VLGYSLGAAVALNVAFLHPELVKKLVVVSTVFRNDGWYPPVQEAMKHLDASAAEPMKPSPLYQNYAKIAPHPEDFPKLLDSLGMLLRTQYDWSQQVAAIKSPTLLVFGDADAVQPEHAVQMFQLLGGGKKDGGLDGSGMSRSRLAILPGTTHYAMLEAPALVPTVTSFLAGPTGPK
jgi:pimeloyl-ACP methyl ester carboxylesterase